MSNAIQRLLLMSDSEVLGLNEQAALGPVQQPRRSQFSHLVRHFLERFFNHETASPDGDARMRLVLIAFATGLPPFMVAIYLWPVYHAFIAIPQKHHVSLVPGPPPYWVQVNHHFFFVLYSFVALGVATVFEWDLFFPDLLDLLVLNTLPIPARRLFFARATAIAILVGGFLFDANLLATVALPEAIDPPSLPRFLAGHGMAVAMGGVFGAAFVLGSQGLLIFVFGERWFRKFSLLVQGSILAVLLLMLLLFPVYSGATPILVHSKSFAARCFPPLWFLGIYQQFVEGPSALPAYTQLARIGYLATLGAIAFALGIYPLAYRRRIHSLVEGANSRCARNRLVRPFHRLLHVFVVPRPVHRAVFHFIGQTLLRVPRYRIYLVLYGSVGVAVVSATVLRFVVVHGEVHLEFAASGIRAVVGIVAFWTIAGLRITIGSPGNRQGNWIFHIVHGRPPEFPTAIELLRTGRTWALLWAGIATVATLIAFRAVSPAEMLTWPATAAQLLVAAGLCLVLTDAFFLNLTTVAFTGEPSHDQPNLALTVLKYFIFFPPIVTFAVVAPIWIEHSTWRAGLMIEGFAAVHLALCAVHRRIVREYCRFGGAEENLDERPLDLGLRSQSRTEEPGSRGTEMAFSKFLEGSLQHPNQECREAICRSK